MFQHKDLRDFEQPLVPELPNLEIQSINASSKLLCSEGCSSLETLVPNTTADSPTFLKEYQSCDVTLSQEIIQPIHCRAIDYFLSSHVFRESGTPRGYYEYLLIFVNAGDNSQPLVASLSGVALAAYANAFRYPELLQQARRYYGHALKLLNAALSSPEETSKNSTLSSVLLLNTFNTLTGETNQSLVPCVSHMVAAMSILSLNGHSLVKSRTFLPLLLQVLWSMLQTYITRSARIPEELIALRQHAASALDTNDPGWKLSEIVLKVAKLRADIKEGILLDSASIVKAALDLDLEFSSFAENMPAQWRFAPIPAKEISELVFGTCYHVYPDQWVAFVWNCLRTSRLLLHTEIRSRLADKLALSHLSFSDLETLDYRASAKIMHQMVFEICATVPQYAGYLEVLNSNETLAEKSRSSEQITNGIPVIAGAYLVLWPLLNAGQCTESDLQRNWIVERCRYIGRMSGIQQAFVFADLIESGDKVC